MFSARSACLAALALAAAIGPAAAQINVNVNIGGRRRPSLGTIGGFRPSRPSARPPLGVVTLPQPLPHHPVRPVPPIGSLRPSIYSPAYLSRFPPGRRTVLVGNVPYFYYSVLPRGAVPITWGGGRFYRSGGMWYQPHFSGGRNIFLAVPPLF